MRIEDEKLRNFRQQMSEFFVGKDEVIENVLCCFLAGGHVLLEDVPGVGKTTLAETFAKSMGLSFGRIQFTPDTMPAEITGLSIYDIKKGEFIYRQGSVMKNIILADELNRTSPKTQSALLEAMAESQVTVDGVIYPLPQPFMVIATQNPIQFMGTYPLPEAQLDRFMMQLSIGYPSREEELRLAHDRMKGKKIEEVKSILGEEDILSWSKKVEEIYISEVIFSYTQEIIEATRNDGAFLLGASPRALLQLLQAARAKSFLEGREFVKPDDVKQVVVPVLSHRLILTPEMRMQKKESRELLKMLVQKVKIPMEGDYGK